jgi:multiple sugar transport system ATP-binding protein
MDKVNKVYENGFDAVKDFSLNIGEGEFMVLVGPSGSGKTTVLRMVAGLEDITSGIVRIGGKEVNDETPKERDVAMIFQNYALYPHMTVWETSGSRSSSARRLSPSSRRRSTRRPRSSA